MLKLCYVPLVERRLTLISMRRARVCSTFWGDSDQDVLSLCGQCYPDFLHIAVHHYTTVNFLFFGQLTSVQVPLIHMISATTRSHEVVILGRETGRESFLQRLIFLTKNICISRACIDACIARGRTACLIPQSLPCAWLSGMLKILWTQLCL